MSQYIFYIYRWSPPELPTCVDEFHPKVIKWMIKKRKKRSLEIEESLQSSPIWRQKRIKRNWDIRGKKKKKTFYIDKLKINNPTKHQKMLSQSTLITVIIRKPIEK